MARLALRIVFVLSISLNIALAIHLLARKPDVLNPENIKENISLNLSSSQREELNGIHSKIHGDNEALRKQISHCQSKLMEALKSETPDNERIHHCIEVISNLQKQIQHNTVEEIVKAKKVLNHSQCSCLIDRLNARLQQKDCSKECCNIKK